MPDFTPEERKVALFFLALIFAGIILSYLVKINCRVAGIVYPSASLARLDLNRVKLEELNRTKCVPARLAQRIIEYRNFHQKFSSLEELKEIKGIGKKRFERLKEIFFIE